MASFADLVNQVLESGAIATKDRSYDWVDGVGLRTTDSGISEILAPESITRSVVEAFAKDVAEVELSSQESLAPVRAMAELLSAVDDRAAFWNEAAQLVSPAIGGTSSMSRDIAELASRERREQSSERERLGSFLDGALGSGRAVIARSSLGVKDVSRLIAGVAGRDARIVGSVRESGDCAWIGVLPAPARGMAAIQQLIEGAQQGEVPVYDAVADREWRASSRDAVCFGLLREPQATQQLIRGGLSVDGALSLTRSSFQMASSHLDVELDRRAALVAERDARTQRLPARESINRAS